MGEESKELRLMEDSEKIGPSEKSAESASSERSQRPEPLRSGDSSKRGAGALFWVLVFSGVDDMEATEEEEEVDNSDTTVPRFTVPYLSSSSEPWESWVINSIDMSCVA